MRLLFGFLSMVFLLPVFGSKGRFGSLPLPDVSIWENESAGLTEL
jgi:hypothetical protein